MIEIMLLLFFPFFMLYAAFSDMLTMTISNKVSLFLIAGFAIFAVSIGLSFEQILYHFGIFIVVLLVGIALFAFNVVGGGDAKLAASTALWLGGHTLEYVLNAAIFGAFLGLFLLLFRSNYLPMRLRNTPWINRLYQTNEGMPYGIALGAAAIMIYPETLWMDHIISKAIAG